MLLQCCAIVYDAGPTPKQHRVNVSCLLRGMLRWMLGDDHMAQIVTYDPIVPYFFPLVPFSSSHFLLHAPPLPPFPAPPLTPLLTPSSSTFLCHPLSRLPSPHLFFLFSPSSPLHFSFFVLIHFLRLLYCLCLFFYRLHFSLCLPSSASTSSSKSFPFSSFSGLT